MRKSFPYLIAAALLLSLPACSRARLSEKMVESEMSRCPDATYLDFLEGTLKWNYTTGLELKAFLDVYEAYGDEHILEYVDSWYDSIIDEDGAIYKYKKSNYSTDHICPARTLFRLYDLIGKEKYRKAMDIIRDQIESQPRTSEGGFWHKQTYPWQMWLDGLYMAQPFYAEYTSRYAPEEQKDSLYRDICRHFEIVAQHTYDEATGLYRHAWDESREMFWCDPQTGLSAHCWGRALGWYCMALVETLDIIPEGAGGREELLEILRHIVSLLPSYADPQTGMWYQVLDCPGREGNYLEATASSMFAYTLLKGVRKGWLDPGLADYAKDVYKKLVEYFIVTDADGLISIKDCCSVAGLGGKEERSGTFDYYIGEPVRSNDAKGVGPFIWASLEMEML